MKLPDPLQNVPEGTFPVTSDLYSDRDILCYIRHFFRDHHSNEKRILLVTSHTLKHR